MKRSDTPTRTISVEQAAVMLGVSRSVAYEAARRFEATGQGLPVVRIGRRLVVPLGRLEALLGDQPSPAAGGD